ncbi:hypothetical protein B0H34DRAFT_277178 [Crassisporium funariophilum]|nr:hypothetical protein B0H34DRAFT_277178 [Crassisporium funariophilum]
MSYVTPSSSKQRRERESVLCDDYKMSLIQGHNQGRRHHSTSSPLQVGHRAIPLLWQTSFRLLVSPIPHAFASPKRALLVILLVMLSTPLVLGLLVVAYGGLPPSYAGIRMYERSLPQHDWSKRVEVTRRPLPTKGSSSTNRKPMYLRFPDHLWGHGLNNFLQEAIMSSYIAYTSNRTFVFEDHVWSRMPLPYTLYDFALRPTRIPLNAYMSGPVAGGHVSVPEDVHSSVFDHSHLARNRAISAEYYEHVCPRSTRASIVYSWDSLRDGRNVDQDADGVEIIDWWRKRLSEGDVRDAQCLEVRESQRRVFDSHFFGSPRVLSLFAELRDSPVLRDFAWSNLVYTALDKVFAHLFPPQWEGQTSHAGRIHALQTTETDELNFLENVDTNIRTRRSVVPGLLAVHLRRGDYKRHCLRLAKWQSSFMGFNRFEGLVDSFDPHGFEKPTFSARTGTHVKEEKESRQAHYLAHCLPTIPQIVHRLHIIRSEQPRSLSCIYILTNAWPSFITALSHALVADGWASVKSSATDTRPFLTREESYVDVSVDMALAVDRAEVFVGNGFSSLSANIVMLRMAKGMPVESNRFL